MPSFRPIRLILGALAVLPLASSLALAQPMPPDHGGGGGPDMHGPPPPPPPPHHRRWHWRHHHRVPY